MTVNNRLDMHIEECDQLLSASIYIVENADAHQPELLRNSTVTLLWQVRDKLNAMAKHLSQLPPRPVRKTNSRKSHM